MADGSPAGSIRGGRTSATAIVAVVLAIVVPVGSGQESPGRRIPEGLRFAHGLLRQRKYDLAAEEYERFLAGNPKGPDRLDAMFGLANARLDADKYPEALRAFAAFLKAAPTDPRARTARYRVGELSYLEGELAASRRALEAFTGEKAPHSALETAWTYLGDVCFSMQDLVAARSAYERSLADYPRGRLADRARYGLARTLAAQGERDRALQLLAELTRRTGTEWVDRAWLQAATIELAAGRPAEALEALDALDRDAPKTALKGEAALRRASALDSLGRADDAVRLLGELAARPDDPIAPRAAVELAAIELRRDRPEPALAAAEAVLRAQPRSPMWPALMFRSAEASRKLGRLEEAQSKFLRVAEGAPDDPWADDALERAAATALDRRDVDAARRLARDFASKYSKSPRLAEARLIEARADAMAGDPKAAAGVLESLLNPPEAEGAGPPLPDSVAASTRYELALAYRALGRSDDAGKLLEQLAASTSGPVADDARFLLGQAHLEAGRFAEAIPMLERYLSANPGGEVAETALSHLVAAQLGAGHFDAANARLAELAQRFPEGKALPVARLRVAEAALAGGRADRAAELFREVAGKPEADSDVDPALRARAMVGLGRSLEASGHPEEAASAFAAAIERSPTDPAAPSLAMARAHALESAGKSDAALDAYADAARRFGRADATLARARLLSKLGRFPDAAEEYRRLLADASARQGLDAAGATPDVLLDELGWSLVDATKPDEADQIFARLLKDHPESPHAADARFNLAESANRRHDYPEVVRLLTPIADAKGKAPERLMPAVLYRLGRTQVELRDWKAAASTLDRLIAEFPESPYRRQARFLRAESALQLGEAEAAGSGFADLLAEPSRPDDPEGFRRSLQLGQVRSWVALKRWKDLVATIPKIRKDLPPDDPATAELDYAMGQAQMGLGRMDEARSTFQAVINAHPGDDLAARAQLMRGESYFHEDRLREALREFLRVDILYKNAPRWRASALLEAGKVYERLDQWADAAETYDRLLEDFPKDPEAETARTRAEAARRRAK